MALTFPKAPRVVAGQPVTSAQWNALADAFNVRERSGLGDFHWRGMKFEANGFLQVRNSNEDGTLTPSMGEFFEIYQLLDSENDPGQWPVASPGDPEGANVVAPLNAFTFGIEAANFPGEELRLETLPLWNRINSPPQSLEEWWELGKSQRGVIDALTGEQNCPTIEAAQSGQLINYSGLRTPHGKGYGGFFPTPLLLGNCGPDELSGAGIDSYQIKFTALRSDVSTAGLHGSLSTVDGVSVVTYAGTCPLNTDYTGDDQVLTIIRMPDFYYVAVVVGGGTGYVWDVYPVADWIEGPYTEDGKLGRYDGQHISRAVWAFVNDFRGHPLARYPDTFDIEKIAFSFQELHSRQWLLAPQRGGVSGAGLAPFYPTGRVTGKDKIASGKSLAFTVDGKTEYNFHAGYVFSGGFAKSTNLRAPVLLNVFNGSEFVMQFTLTPEEPTSLQFIGTSVFPQPLRVKLATEAKFDGDGEITFEATELLAYKPNYWDAYLLLRLSATKGGFAFEGSFLDGSGIDQTAATEFYKNYLRLGCISNTVAAGVRSIEDAISPNPVYDAGRRLSRDMCRIVRRQEYLSYEVIDGKSVLRFKRFAFGLKNTKADIFFGIAPSYRPTPEVVEGVEYVVRSHTGGRVTYAGKAYALNQRFTGLRGWKTFEVEGDAELFEYQGIRATAPRNGYSNEWLMSIETHVYHPSPTSLWKTDSYSDWYLNNNRCLFYAYFMNGTLARHVDLPSNYLFPPELRTLHLSPEAPSGYNYTLGTNQDATTPEFCSSCQIYQAPYELESATVEFVENGDDIVRLVLKTRMRSHPDAPASFVRDATTWDANNIRVTQDYRTDDNALCEYQLWKALGLHGTFKVGDGAAENYVQGLPDNPFGSIMPRFFFTSLIKKVYEDGNNIANATDTRVLIDEARKAERKLKSWCEGSIDAVTTSANVCGTGLGTYDFLFENLCQQAFSGREIADFNGGFGPQVNTEIKADLFNKIAACVDLLNRFRVDGLMKFQIRESVYEGTTESSATEGFEVCPAGATGWFFYSGCPPGVSLISTGDWTDALSFAARSSASAGQCGESEGFTSITLVQSRTEIEFRYIAKEGFENAIPPILQGLIDNNNIGVFGTATRTVSSSRVDVTSDGDLYGDCGGVETGAFAIDGSTGYYFPYSLQVTDLGCMELTHGFQAGQAAPCGVFAGCSEAFTGPPIHQHGAASTSNDFEFVKLGDDGFAMIVVPVV